MVNRNFFAFEAQICIYVVFDLKTQFSYKNYNNKSLLPITPQHYEGISVNLQQTWKKSQAFCRQVLLTFEISTKMYLKMSTK